MDISSKKGRLLFAVYRGFCWFLRNTHHAFTLLKWLSTGQFAQAGRALLPYYRQYVPARLRTMIPDRMRRAAQRWIRIKQPWNVKINYANWIVKNDMLTDQDRLLIRKHITSFKHEPKFSILMPLSNTRPKYLSQAIESVLNQIYQDWELCIVCDGSTKREMHALMEKYSQRDSRIRPHSPSRNGSISDRINMALEMATGDWIALMNPDDVLSEHALYLVADILNREPDVAIIYSDHDHIDAKGRHRNPYFKPDWDYDLFLGQNYINPLCAYRADLVHRAGGARKEVEGAHDWDFELRILESAPDAMVHHIPFILCHQRAKDGTFAKSSPANVVNAAQRAVNEHFIRTKQGAVALPKGSSSHLRIKWSIPANHPLVSIIIPTKDQYKLLQTCIDGLVNRTNYRPLEIIVVDNGSSEPDTLAFLAEIGLRENIKVMQDPLPFNFARLVNLGVTASSGDICVLLNNDVDVINPEWLDEMVSHSLRPDVGAVGAKLYYSNNTLQHGGVILGIYNSAGSVAAHAHHFLPRKSSGYFGSLILSHCSSCVTAACLATRRMVYDSLGGFNEQDLAVSFNDVDFCLRLRQAGYRIIWTPHAEL
ncbi:MAG: glycosyltransferase, partial [Desulfobacteraceae bacterium]|nr:glycosyltransferase [Desulfobacteraceae bacterium]